jgi:hypothetical protein
VQDLEARGLPLEVLVLDHALPRAARARADEAPVLRDDADGGERVRELRQRARDGQAGEHPHLVALVRRERAERLHRIGRWTRARVARVAPAPEHALEVEREEPAARVAVARREARRVEVCATTCA